MQLHSCLWFRTKVCIAHWDTVSYMKEDKKSAMLPEDFTFGAGHVPVTCTGDLLSTSGTPSSLPSTPSQ